ncbi:fructose-1 6-bisphosphatase [Striga asiatica]|uniref:Fructose-1 6-bisphosphatase n=1 Tax=Striga asiatica TaxID=4170 RepID=A0A5A7QEN7_STRAF|nr:fructose-1 6-bisphosphatase [Striga asiatica]
MGAARINGGMIRHRLCPRVPLAVLLSCSIILGCSPEELSLIKEIDFVDMEFLACVCRNIQRALIVFCTIGSTQTNVVFVSAAVVTLDSMVIIKTHEWLPSKPSVYFQCKGEDKITLPDVKEKNVPYTFKEEESWQPLTEFKDKKCKRCGFYEKDAIKTVIFDEWELCPADFKSPGGKYFHFKAGEFNASFLCSECVPQGQENTAVVKIDSKQLHWAIIVVLTIVVSTILITGLVSACKWWQKRKRQQQQARFLKLFEETDDVEDELGIGPLSHSI